MLQAKAELMSNIEDIVKCANGETKRLLVSNTSKSYKLKGIRKNRKAEKHINRCQEMFVLGKEDVNSKVVDKTDKEEYGLKTDKNIFKIKRGDE